MLPCVVCFEDDETARRAVGEINKFRKLSFEDLATDNTAELIFLLTTEKQIASAGQSLRRPNARVLALMDTRCKDARLDGAVYAYLPKNTPGPLIERMVQNAVDHIQLLANRQELNTRLQNASKEIHELNQIGAALSAQHDTPALLDMILQKCREITRSDAGSLYLVEHEEEASEPREEIVDAAAAATAPPTKLQPQHEGRKSLRFKLAQNDSVHIPFREMKMEISERSIAGYVALTGETVNIEDAYRLPPQVPYSINRKFDEDSGYRTKSILAVPMRNQQDEIVGVVQLLNSKRDWNSRLESLASVKDQVVNFGRRQEAIVQSLASQAAVALENSQLYEAIQRLFEGFVRASVIAIEARDPTTSGHSFRVANLTVALAEAVDRADSGPFTDLTFTRTEMKEIRYASLLHDFGKVGVREEVLVKAKKLYPAQLDLIKQRFQFVKRSMESEVLKKRLSYVLEKSRDEYLQKSPEFDSELAAQVKELDEYLQIVLKADEPTVLPEGSFDSLLSIAARRFLDMDNVEIPLLNVDEVRLLSIRKGSLDDAERLQIESHVVHTYNFLEQIPWTKEIKNIPSIARGHHEKLNGKGYPYKLSAPEIPVQTRIMTISDIFDALSATDRPYKRAVGLDRALQILEFAVKDGEIDPVLFELFKEAKVFEKWKVEPYPY